MRKICQTQQFVTLATGFCHMEDQRTFADVVEASFEDSNTSQPHNRARDFTNFPPFLAQLLVTGLIH